MITIIIAINTLIVVSLYASIAKNAAYQRMIDNITPAWNISITLS